MNQNPRFSTMPQPGQSVQNVELASAIDSSATFTALAQELAHEREMQAMRHLYYYVLSGSLAGQQTQPFILSIEQGSDFKCMWITGSGFYYDSTGAAPSLFPVPNSAGLTRWAGRGLSMQIVDSGKGRELASGFIPLECILTPGYGLNFQNPLPFKYLWERNSKVRIDVRNRDAATTTHQFEIVLMGYKVYTPM
jgi:hypothetical protein